MKLWHNEWAKYLKNVMWVTVELPACAAQYKYFVIVAMLLDSFSN